MIKIIEMTLGDEILEVHKLTEVRILEVETEVILEMIVLEEVEVGLGKGSMQVILEEMIEAAVDLDQVQE